MDPSAGGSVWQKTGPRKSLSMPTDPATFATFPATPEALSEWMRRSQIRDVQRGATNLRNLADSRVPGDLLASVVHQLQTELRSVSDPDMALNFFERFFLSARSRLSLAALMDRDPTAIRVLLKIFSTSNYLSELLIRDQESFDVLRMTEGQPQTLEVMQSDICGVLGNVADPAIAMRTLRRFKQRETLRIAFGDLVVQHRLGMVTEQISWLAEALCQAALEFATRHLEKKWGRPRDSQGHPVSCVILAMGKLGGRELNYSSDIDLVLVFGATGQCDGSRARSNQEFFEELTRDFTKLMGENTPNGFAWRVDWRLRPEGQKGRLSNSAEAFLRYYEQKGRAWERQALIKARPVAGDLQLGRQILEKLEPWIWRRLSHFDVTAVRSLKRQIERRAIVEGVDLRDVKTGRGGIRDIEFTTQFLQLMHGRKIREIRQFNTLQALEQLQRAGLLTLEEESLLMQNYIWLRKLEHRLQIMSDLQTHRLPDDPQALERIALRMGYVEAFGERPLARFQADYEEITAVNRRILDHQLHQTFAAQPEGELPEAVDLIYVSEVDAAHASRALEGYTFADPLAAALRIQGLGTERSIFLSASRCRHFLAAILPGLLREICATTDPDRTLNSLYSVTEQLGAKGVLWEMFSVIPNAMQLFVRLCAQAGYLTAILRDNPGMIDELVDALLVGQLPGKEWLQRHLNELTGSADDPSLIIHSFKQAQHLRIGTVDLLGESEMVAVNRTLSDVADVCLETIAGFCLRKVQATRGVPWFVNPDGSRRPCQCAIVACGKLGGREMNYQSDLDLFFLFEADGQTEHPDPQQQTSNQHFFSDWASEVTRFVSARTAVGRLYELDSRLRPSGKSGSLATSLQEMLRYFRTGQGQSWESLALCKARVVWTSDNVAGPTDQVILEAITARDWSAVIIDEIAAMRERMEQQPGTSGNLKRGPGGTVDIEFAVQLVQLRYVREYPQLRNPSAPELLRTIAELQLLPAGILQTFSDGFRLLRTVESSLRLCDESPRNSLTDPPGLAGRIAKLMHRSSAPALVEEVRNMRAAIREAWLQVLEILRRC